MSGLKRVVVTGMGGITALGSDWATVAQNLKNNVSGIQAMPEWDDVTDLRTRLAGPIRDFKLPEHYTRKVTRTMGRVAMFSVRATELALTDAGLLNDPSIQDGRMGVAYGSCTGNIDAGMDFAYVLDNRAMGKLNVISLLKYMSHTAVINLGVHFGLKGRMYTTTSACTCGSQGVGYAYEAIKYGKQSLMVAGGAEELNLAEAAVFDSMYATSRKNDAPQTTPAPFDKDRDGLVIGEGGATLILEEYEHAKARGATIYAEIVGYGTNADGAHVTQPNRETIRICQELALQDAGLPPSAIGYVSAHGTGTDQGDVAESHASAQVFGSRMPISSMKGHLGHTLGGCGAIESWWGIEMMRAGWFAPTLNLHQVDPACAELDYIQGKPRLLECEYVMNNNFAFGGINTSLIFKRV